MPEGPETLKAVDFIKSQFKHDLKAYTLVEVAQLTNRFRVDMKDFNNAIDKPIRNISCKGKFYFLELGGNVSVVCHHGMKGHWSLEEESNSHFRFVFVRMLNDIDVDEDSLVTLYFTNVRLGDFNVYTDDAKLHTVRVSLASGFIGDHVLTLEEFLVGLEKFTHRKRLRDILFDQHGACSGLGNYLIAEIMYYMKLHPMARLGDLKKPDKVKLYEVCRELTIGFYKGTSAKIIYKQETDPFGNKVEVMTVGSRSAYWVPTIQLIGSN